MQDIPTTTSGMTQVERADIYRYWQSRTTADRMGACGELTRRKYTELGYNVTPPHRSTLVERKLTLEQWRRSEEMDLVP